MFEKPNGPMKIHLKPLFTQANVDYIRVTKVLVDGGAAVNLMPQSLLKKIGKCGTDLKPHNIVISNYEGKTGFSLPSLQLNLTVGSVTGHLCSWQCHQKQTSTCFKEENGYMELVLFLHLCIKKW